MSSNGETIKILRSNTAGASPSLTAGEIAINMADKKLFVGNNSGSNIVFRDESYVSQGGVTGDTVAQGTGISVTRTNNAVTVNLAAAYQVTGHTVTTTSNSGISIQSAGNQRTIQSIGVTGIAIAGTAITLTGGISLTGSGGVSITRTNNQLTISSSVGGGATGDTILPDGQPGVTDGAIWVSTVSGNTKRVTARMTTSVLVGANGIPSGMPGANTGVAAYFETDVEHGKTGVAYFNDAHFLVRPQYGLVNLRNPFVGFAPDSGMTTITGGSGEDQYTFDIDSLSEMTVGMVEPTDYVLVYDASLTNGNKTRKIPVSKLILDTDTLFETANPDQLVKTKSASAISYEIVTAPVTADSQSLLKSGDAYSYITQNTAASINGCTGAFTITGTENEVTVTTGINCRNIVIGLPDNVSVPYLSGTGATFTQTVTANRFIGSMDGGYF